jgi:hypothetical protein
MKALPDVRTAPDAGQNITPVSTFKRGLDLGAEGESTMQYCTLPMSK